MPAVAAYWRDHYRSCRTSSRAIGRTSRRSCKGKIHLYVGNGDNYYLTDSVYFAQERLESLQPPYGGTRGVRRPCRALLERRSEAANAYSRLHYNFQYLPMILEAHRGHAPAGADLKSWRY